MKPMYPPARLAWFIWGLGAGLYLIAFFHRVAPAVMGDELMREFAAGAAVLGNLSGLYFYSYVAMQVPTGILADRWGPRRLLTAGAAVAAVGGLMFALGPSLWLVGAGRLLVGASVAVAFVCMIKLASQWMAPRQFAFATGVALLVGSVGALGAGPPLALMVEAVGWRAVMAAVALLTGALTIALWLWVRDDPSERGYRSHAPELDGQRMGFLAGLAQVSRYRNTWLLTLAPGGLTGAVLAFAGLWGVPFLTTHYGLDLSTAAAYCSGMLLAFALGGPIAGGLSDRIGRRKPLYLAGAVAALASWALVILVPGLPQPVLLGALLLASFGAGAMIIGFAFAKESVPGQLAGTVAGLVNMGVMVGPMLLQPAIGLLLDGAWDGTLRDGLRVYSLEAYRSGFLLMLVWTALALVLVAATRETGCRPLADDARPVAPEDTAPA